MTVSITVSVLYSVSEALNIQIFWENMSLDPPSPTPPAILRIFTL